MISRFRQLFESSPDAMVIVDRTGKISAANARAESLFGYPRDQLRGKFAQTLFPGQSMGLETGGPQEPAQASRQHLVGSRSDRRQFPADVTLIPISTKQGTVTVISVADITEALRTQFVLELGFDVLESADRGRQALLGHVIRAQERERSRIAADIHDDTIQVLTAANLRLQQLRHRLRDPDQLRILDKLEQTLNLSLSRLRQLIFDLRPSNLERGSLAPTLRAYLEQLSSDTGIVYQFEDGCTGRASAASTRLIYRTAQEALANVRKHSRATTVRVQFLEVSDGCLARITDDGVGYDPSEVEDRPGHLGLTLMRERTQIAGGWCRIESTPAGGTTVEFWVPLARTPHQPEASRERVA